MAGSLIAIIGTCASSWTELMHSQVVMSEPRQNKAKMKVIVTAMDTINIIMIPMERNL